MTLDIIIKTKMTQKDIQRKLLTLVTEIKIKVTDTRNVHSQKQIEQPYPPDHHHDNLSLDSGKGCDL